MADKILAVVAHPDDETFWMGAALASHSIDGDYVSVLALSDGFGSRQHGEARGEAFLHACMGMDVNSCEILPIFPDQRADTVPQLDINKKLEAWLDSYYCGAGPDRVYTHFIGDLNLDHRRVSEAVLVATRGICPVYMARPEELGRSLWPFKPDKRRSVKVEPVRAIKLAAVQCYPTELRPTGPRSLSYFQTEEKEHFEVRE